MQTLITIPIYKRQINSGRLCPYCGNPSEHIDNSEIYGFSTGMIFICQPCGAWVGTKKGFPEISLGRLANSELREAKSRAYTHFQMIIKRGHMPAKQAYLWLARQLRIPVKECHFGWFDLKQCNKVIDISKKFLGT